MIQVKRLANWKTAAAVIGGYFAINGLVTFPLFITEEAIQTAQGGTWAAKAAKDWDFMREGCAMVGDMADSLESANRATGWINPFGFPAYARFARGAHYYAEACTRQANAGADGRRKGKDD
jgi:hypothetical protein